MKRCITVACIAKKTNPDKAEEKGDNGTAKQGQGNKAVIRKQAGHTDPDKAQTKWLRKGERLSHGYRRENPTAKCFG